MSRKGKKKINIPEKTEVKITKSEIIVKGPKGELKQSFPEGITFEIENNELAVKRADGTKK